MKILSGYLFNLHLALCSVAGCIIPQQLRAQPAPSIQELAERALAISFERKNAQLERDRDRQSQLQIRERYIPRLEAGGRFAFSQADLLLDLPTTTLSVIQTTLFEGLERFDSRGRLLTGNLTATAVLFSGLQVPNLQKALGAKIHAQEQLLERQKQEIINQVATAYDQLALLIQAQDVLAESTKRLEVEKQTAEKAFEQGLITAFEKSKVTVAEASLQAQISEIAGQYRLLLAHLSVLTGVEIDTLRAIRQPLLPLVLASETFKDDHQRRPEGPALQSAVAAQRYRLRAAQAWMLPQVMAFSKLGYLQLSHSSLKTPFPHPTTEGPITLRLNHPLAVPHLLLGVGLRWTVFDGMYSKREVNKAKMEVQQAQNEQQRLQSLMALEVDQARTTYQLAVQQLEIEQNRFTHTEEALALAQKEFRVGLIRPTDRLKAETDYQQAALAFDQAVFKQRRAAYELLLAQGTLSVEALK